MIVPNQAIAYFIALIIIGTLVPVIITIIFVKIKKAPITTVLAGALTFLVFAVVLETIPKVFLLQLPNPISKYILSHPWALVLVGALLAGIFEETGRFLVFKLLLRKRTSPITGMAHGLGHGLFEVMYIFVISGIQYLVYVFMINSGTFDQLIQEAIAKAPEQAAALQALPEQLAAITFATLPLAILERCGAVLFHLGASMLVFYAIRKPGKIWLFPVAILLHTLLDIFACLGQVGIITNVYVIEIIVIGFGAAMFLLNYFFTYRKLKNDC